MGDVIHALPAISDIQQFFQDKARIDWVVEEAYTALPQWHPGVADVIPFSLRRWRKNLNWQSCSEFCSYLHLLRGNTYEAVIDLQGLLKSALFGCVPADGPSHGYDRSSARESAACAFYRHCHTVGEMHAVTRSRHLVAKVLGYPVPASPPDYGIKAAEFKAVQREAIVLVPNTAQPRKLWPEERWIALGKKLQADGLQVEVMWGNKSEQERASRIASACGGTVAERLELGSMAAFLAGARGMVSLDTGLAHMAAALALPNVCLCVATDPALSGALGPKQDSVGDAISLSATDVHARFNKIIDSSTG